MPGTILPGIAENGSAIHMATYQSARNPLRSGLHSGRLLLLIWRRIVAAKELDFLLDSLQVHFVYFPVPHLPVLYLLLREVGGADNHARRVALVHPGVHRQFGFGEVLRFDAGTDDVVFFGASIERLPVGNFLIRDGVPGEAPDQRHIRVDVLRHLDGCSDFHTYPGTSGGHMFRIFFAFWEIKTPVRRVPAGVCEPTRCVDQMATASLTALRGRTRTTLRAGLAAKT